jgi:DNA polymerase IV
VIFAQGSKAIVTPQWLLDSSQQGRLLPCGEYAALGEIRDETVEHCPDGYHDDGAPCSSPSRSPRMVEARTPPPDTHNLSYKAKLACCRASPLVCPNQGLLAELDIIRRSRWMDGEDVSALSYARSIAALKGSRLAVDTLASLTRPQRIRTG